MKKLLLLSVCSLLLQYEAHAGIKATFDDMLYETRMRLHYYKPYMITGSLVGMSALTNKLVGSCLVAGAAGYSIYAWWNGFFEIREIRHKYKRNLQPKDHWSSKPEEKPFLFCRWRQQDDQFGDGIYWPTAWWAKEYKDEIIKTLIKDIYSNRIILIHENKKIELPRPDEVLRAINNELKELETDKEALKKYTDIYRTLESGSEFKADKSYLKIFWPNYNHASRLYIELVTMMKRLEVLRDIISNMKLSTGGHGWPQVK